MEAAAAGAAAAMGTERKPSVASSKSADVRTEHEVWHAASQGPWVVPFLCSASNKIHWQYLCNLSRNKLH